ncbi:aerobactin siderophore biosynthesis protein iucB, partial [Pyrenophora tritici-repentis]
MAQSTKTSSNPEALTLKLPHPYLTSYEITTSLAGHQVLLAKSTSSSQAIPPPEVLHNNTLFFSNIAFLADNAVPPTGDNSSWARARKSPHLTVSWTAEPPSVPQIWLVAYALVTLHPLVEHLRVVFSGKNSDLVVQQLHATGLYHPHPKPSNVSAPQDGHLLLRGTFWQGAASPFGARPVWAPELDASNKPIANYPAFPFHNALVTQFPAVPRHTSHPVRKPKPQPGSVVYSRWIPHLKEHFTLIALDYTNLDHLSLFHNWQNDPREDHIGAYYQSSPYDRGRHSLVGDIRFRGPYRVSAWWSSLVHYLFLDEPRTWNLVGEPAATSSTVLAYDFAHGFHVEKLLDLPHKRSALMIVNREKFFTLSPFVWDGEQK